jgi:hypothetical protein
LDNFSRSWNNNTSTIQNDSNTICPYNWDHRYMTTVVPWCDVNQSYVESQNNITMNDILEVYMTSSRVLHLDIIKAQKILRSYPSIILFRYKRTES